MSEIISFDSELGHWKDIYGHSYIKNEFDPDNPVYINISTDIWEFGSAINWSDIRLSKNLKKAAKNALKSKLKKVSESYTQKFTLMLLDLASILHTKKIYFNADDINIILNIWGKLRNPSNKIFFREMYRYFSKNNILGATPAIYLKLKKSKARNNVVSLKYVVNWHPTRGALTVEEENLVRDYIENDNRRHAYSKGVRLMAWLLFSTLKRGKQIRELKIDCTRCVENKDIKEYFVEVKPVKAQTGNPLRWWPIPEHLYNAMIEYSKIPSVKALQNRYNLFFVSDWSTSTSNNGLVDANEIKTAIKDYFRPIISPRTKEPINVTPLRIRHTGATRMAYSGVSRDIISEVLEHDSPDSCQAYIDAIGSELCPQIDSADRNMGNFFTELNHIYFNGKIVDKLNEQPIIIPVIDEHKPNPLFVGSCGKNTVKDGKCYKHPFIGCYNGCPNFLAWREADHKTALNYIETEIKHWGKANINEETETTIKEFKAVRDNILIVIERIESTKNQEIKNEIK